MSFRRLLAALLVAFAAAPAARAFDEKDVSYSIQPIVGYEFQRKENPARAKTVFTYGARLIAGYEILSAEAEYTQGRSDELFAATGTRIEEKTEKIRAGLRSTYGIGTLLDWFLRGGAELQKIHTKTTVSGTATERDSPSNVYPYVGTGVEIHLASVLSLNASVLATIKDVKDMKQNEYTTTFGLKIALNTTR